MGRYSYYVDWSDEDQVYVARVAEFKSLAAHGESPEAALAELKFVVDEVVKDLQVEGEPVPEPLSQRKFSGRLVLRMPISMHRELALEANREGVSLNQLINLKLARAS